MGQYLPILAMIVLAGLFAGVSLIASKILNPGRPTIAQTAPYECGIVDQTPPPERFPVRFYLVAMIFIIFDIEIIFLYPFTSVFHDLGSFGLVAVMSFGVAVFASFLYLVSNGALDWGPAKHVRRGNLGMDRDRTVDSTVRRVGLEGRAPAMAGGSSSTPDHEAA